MPGWSHHSAVTERTAGNLSVGVIMPDNGQVERMNRTLKEATVKRFHYETQNQLRSHLDDFVKAYNFDRRLKTLKGSPPSKPSAKPGQSSRKDSRSIRSIKCRD